MTNTPNEAPTGLTAVQLDQLLFDLSRLPEMFSWLDGRTTPERSNHEGGSKRPRPGSRVPLDLAVVAMLDIRTKRAWSDIQYDMPEQAGEEHRRLGILPTLAGWSVYAEGVLLDDDCEVRLLSTIDPPSTVESECAWLAEHAELIAPYPWAVQLLDQVAGIIRDLEPYSPRRLPARDERRDLTLWPMPEVSDLMCTHDAADWLRVAPSVVRKWIHRHHLDYARDDAGHVERDGQGRRLLRRADLLACAARRGAAGCRA